MRIKILILAILFTCPLLGASKFYPDDPIWNDSDHRDIPKPKEMDIVRIHDFIKNSFSDPGGKKGTVSENINTLGEVPDSSWFTNRIGRHSMTLDEVSKGPNRSSGPDTSGDWLVLKAKTEGASPGLVIKDRREDVYFVKFDAPETPELQSSAEVISTKILYASGYNVPENYVAFIRPRQLKADGKSEGKNGKRMSQVELNEFLERMPRRRDRSFRVLASLRLPGEGLGGFEIS